MTQLSVMEMSNMPVQAVLSLCASGRTTGLVEVSCHDASHPVICEVYALPHSSLRLHVTCRDVTENLMKVFFLLRAGDT